MDQALDQIPTMSDVELYLQSLENELQQMGAQYKQWITVLTPKLPPSLNGHIGDLQAKPNTIYDDLKCRLLERAVQTALQAGRKVFDLSIKELKGKFSLQLIQFVDRSLNRIIREVHILEEAKELCIARIRSLFSIEEQQYLDGWRIKSKDDLREAL